MADTSIEWTDKVWNPLRGCSLVSAGCQHCYAMKQAHRFSGPGGAYEGLTKMTSHGPTWTGKVRLVPELLDEPLTWTKPKRVFVNSMSDLFHEDVPIEFIQAVFTTMALAQRHTFQVLTKRPERMRDTLARIVATELHAFNEIPLRNVWLGVSVEDQETAEQRIPILLETPAAVRWISAEPLLGPVNIGPYLTRTNLFGAYMPGFADPLPGLQWVVAGGESGPRARPMHPDWCRHIRNQCAAARVPFLFKQWGEHAPNDRTFTQIEESGRPCVTVSLHADGSLPAACMDRVGKKAAGRTLDGRTHDEYPA